MSASNPVVCLLTDFGLTDHYVGAMKAVLLSWIPQAQIIDLTHGIPPQNIRLAAYHLLASYRYHPRGTMFICVVDPGVGSERKIIYMEAGGWHFIAPDNGLLSWMLTQETPTRIIDISHPSSIPLPVSKTFHGRDIMAPVGGRILGGEDPAHFGPTITSYEKIPFPLVNKMGAMWSGEVLAVDRYGNLVTNFRGAEIAPLANKSKIWIEMHNVPETIRGISDTYASVAPGKLLALDGSSGFVEISVRDGSAAQKTGLKEGSPLTLHFRT